MGVMKESHKGGGGLSMRGTTIQGGAKGELTGNTWGRGEGGGGGVTQYGSVRTNAFHKMLK